MAPAMSVKGLILVGLVVACHTLTMDQEATNDAIAAALSAQNGGEVAIVLRPHAKGPRRTDLMHVKGEEDDSASLYYTKKSHKVSLESLNGGHLKSVSWALGSDTKGILTLVVSPNRVKLYVGCKALHSHSLPGRYDLLTLLTNDKCRVYHEEGAPVEIYGNEHAALDALNCDIKDNPLVSIDNSDMVDVRHYDDRIKREEMQGDDYRTNFIESNGVLPTPGPPRGDIPSTDIDCDERVLRQLETLIQTVNQLRREIADQKGTIDRLNGQLRECCHRQPSPVERCTDSSCYRG